MSFFLDITPIVRNGRGDFLRLGTVRYVLTDEQLTGIDPNTREVATAPGYNYFFANTAIQFEVKLINADTPQPIAPSAFPVPGYLRGVTVKTTGAQLDLSSIDEPNFLD